PRQLREALEYVRDPARELYRGRALLEHAHRDLANSKALAISADHELARENILLDDACPRDRQKPLAHERLEAVRVGAFEAERRAEQAVVREARDVARVRAVVARASEELRSDHHVELAGVEELDGATMKIGVTEVD